MEREICSLPKLSNTNSSKMTQKEYFAENTHAGGTTQECSEKCPSCNYDAKAGSNFFQCTLYLMYLDNIVNTKGNNLQCPF